MVERIESESELREDTISSSLTKPRKDLFQKRGTMLGGNGEYLFIMLLSNSLKGSERFAVDE